MAETFIFSPASTDQELLDNINNQTKFVVGWDNYNLNPTGWPNTYHYANDSKTPLIEILIKKYPNCCFIMDRILHLDDADNIVWLPMWWIDAMANHEYDSIKIDWLNKRDRTAHYLTGQYRISRVLTNFWLAKNYPLDQLLYTNKPGNNKLNHLIDIITQSSYKEKNDFSPRVFLNEIFWHDPYEPEWHKTFSNILHPQYHAKSYLSFTQVDNGIEICSTLSEKVFHCLVAGNFSLHLGNYKITDILKDLGFDVFEDLFDHNHLHSRDRYGMTMQGLRNNKNFIIDHQAVESSWFDNIDRLKNNQKLSMDRSHWFTKFKKEILLLKHSQTLSVEGDFPWWFKWILEY